MIWKRMTIKEYAAYQQANGIKTLETDGIWWAEVKPCFYRPLLPWTVINPSCAHYPPKSHIGGVQHAVPPNTNFNSCFNLFFLDDLQNYSLNGLCSKRRYNVKKSLEHFTTKQITDSQEFKDQAYSIYIDFYQRTHYGYKKDRQQRAYFNAWADSLFADPKLLILGACHREQLSAVNISCQVDDIIIGSTFFANTSSLSLGISDYFMHIIRETAAKSDASRIFYGWATGARGLDDFKIHRGCILEKLPAWYRLNPLIHCAAKILFKNKLGKLTGAI